jgi:hypothetical protein
MKTGFLVLVISMSPICFSADVYKCIDAERKRVVSDKQCTKNTSQEKINYKEASLEDQLIGSAPGKSKVLDISTKGNETLVDFQFTTQTELQEFMRLSGRLSGKNVSLLNVVMPNGIRKGHAKLKITDKDTGLFKKRTNS